MRDVIWSFATLLCLIPILVLPYRGLVSADGEVMDRPNRFWAALLLAVAAPAVWSLSQMMGSWIGSFSHTLWITDTVCLALFAGLCAISRWGWRLTPLLAPYVCWVGLVATVFAGFPGDGLRGGAPGPWIDLHIAVSVLTYALLTLSAVASLAAFLQQRALKTKRMNPLTRFLPPVVESDRLQLRLLMACEAILGLGLVTGVAVLHFERGVFFRPDHKTLLSIATFLVIGALLFAHTRTGLRGKIATRFILIAYLLLTLGYPGVKFVTDVLVN